MAFYSKVCPICQDLYKCTRVDTIYCGKKCSNRARSFPQKTLAQLINRISKFTLVCNDEVAYVQDKQGDTVILKGYEPEGATINNPLGNDEGLLKALALEELQKRQRQASLKSDTGFGVIVEESNEQLSKDNNNNDNNDMDTSSSTNNLDTQNYDNDIQIIQQPQQKKFKIKPIQRNGG